MDIKVQIRTVELLLKIITGNIDKLKLVTYEPQKKLMNNKYSPEQLFLRSTPEEQGISSQFLGDFLRELVGHRGINLHGIMIIRKGYVIAEGAVAPYDLKLWHISHSLCKSITGIAIGMAIEEGYLTLEDRVVDIFKKRFPIFPSLRIKNVTIEHLLTMCSGVNFNETGAVTEDDWVIAFLESGVGKPPGKEFAYNSMNTFMLSAIIKEKTGQGLTEFLTPRLFEPLGIKHIYWEKSPTGIEKGGWGLSITMEDMGKLGQLFLQKGMWKGKRLLSEDWIKEATSKKINTHSILDSCGYGYQVWMGHRKNSYLFNGMLGQNVLVFPDIQLIIVTTAGNTELFLSGPMQQVLNYYFGELYTPSDVPLPVNNKKYKELQYIQSNLERYRYDYKDAIQENKDTFLEKLAKKRLGIVVLTLQEKMQLIINKEYSFEKNTARLMPIFLQCLHNNYAQGISKIGFVLKDETLMLQVKEARSQYQVAIGFYKAEKGILNINKEKYEVACKGEFTTNEDDIMVLKIVLSFIETTNQRLIKFFFFREHLVVEMDEKPGLYSILEGVSQVLKYPTDIPLLEAEYTQFRLEKSIAPRIAGKRMPQEPSV